MAAVAQRRGSSPRRLCRKHHCPHRTPSDLRAIRRGPTPMPKNILTRGHSRALTRHHKIAAAGVAALGAAAIGISAVPSDASTTVTSEAAAPAAKVAYSTEQIKDVRASVTDQLAGASVKAEQIAAKKKAAARAKAEAAAKKKAAAAAAKKAEQARQAKESAGRAADRAQVKKAAAPKSYANNLDGWIRESLDIMKKHGIPGSYEGIHRNIMRESSGNPKAINL